MNFYSTHAKNRSHSPELQATVRSTVSRLLESKTTSENPGVLLGRIQSGKTTAFIGIIAEAFDHAFDIAIVLTKNSQLLGTQTTRRIRKEFFDFEDKGHISIYYAHTFGETVLKKSQMLNKKIFIAIKNPSSIAKLTKAFRTNNPDLCDKRVLIIDDEADTGSVGAKGKKEETELLETAKKLDAFRSSLSDGFFLQVTATPYALYLQPNEIATASGVYKPVRPRFTEILETYPGYVGGKVYFEDSEDFDNPAYHIHIRATTDDVATLKSKKQDLRIVKNVATTNKLEVFRNSIEKFLVAVAIRRAQEIKQVGGDELENYQLAKYSFIFHLDTAKTKMVWQETLVAEYLAFLHHEWKNNRKLAIARYKDHYENDLYVSLEKARDLGWIDHIPSFNETEEIISRLFELEDYQIFVINSDQRLIDLANDDGQLRLETALNFFIGGQVLDRGITIDNLLAMFYGRDPQSSQMDTVLQHARMYGKRSNADIALTRMYTTERIFERMKEIHQIDESLRESLINGPDHEIVIMEASQNGAIKPASPNKIRLGKVTVLRSNKTKYPTGFETKGATELTRITTKLDSYLRSIPKFTNKMRTSFSINFDQFEHILDRIDEGNLNYNLGVPLDIIVWKTAVRRMLEECDTSTLHCYVQEGRDLQRFQKNGEPMDAPYTSTTDLRFSLETINNRNKPLLMLLRQNGTAAGWKNAPFYWPVLVNPEFERPLLFEWS
ncbi:MAG: Z1 domain-containing protein [Pyrinomonadaceae bacterium]